MRVEVDDAEGPVAPGQRPQDRQRDRVVSAHAQRGGARRGDGVDPALDRLVRPLDGDRHHVDVPAVGHAQPVEGMDLQHRIPGTDDRRLLAHGARTEARPRAVRRSPVVWHAEQRHVEPGEALGRRQQHEGRDLPEARRLERVAWRELGHQSARPRPATAWASRATSSGELNTEKLARLVPTTPHQRMSGWAQ